MRSESLDGVGSKDSPSLESNESALRLVSLKTLPFHSCKDYARFLLMLLQKADLLGIVDSLSARESLMVSESFSMNLKGVILVPMSALNAPLLGSRRSVLHLSCGPNNSSGGVLSAA